MENNILLSISGSQMVEDEVNNLELVTQGCYYEKDNVKYIEYYESELSGLDGCKTIISVDGDTVSMMRHGNAEAHMVFKKGERCVNLYSTPYGSLEMGCYPLEMISCMSADGGNLALKYQLDISGRYASQNTLNLRYTKGAVSE